MKKNIIVLFLLLTNWVIGQTPWQLSGGGQGWYLDDTADIKYFYMDTTLSNNIWQISKPQKTYFNSSFSPQNALVTDTVTFYPNSNFSTASMHFLTAEGFIEVSFYHKFDTDTLMDGGTVEISVDSGATWHNLFDDSYWIANNYTAYNYFCTINDTVKSLNQPGISGRSNNWEWNGFFFMYQNAISETPDFFVRFIFASDSINNNREGWMIDDINIVCSHMGIKDVLSSNVSYFFPNPSTGLLFLKDKFDFITITDLLGKKINELIPEGNTINISEFENGMYNIQLYKDREVYNQRVILRK